MTAANPYAAPQSVVADPDRFDDEVQPVRPLSWRGRIGRLRLMAYLSLAYLAFVVGGFLLLGLAGPGTSRLGLVFVAPGLVLFAVASVLFHIQRAHDLNWPGWLWILMFVPLVGLAFFVVPGSKGRNRYGAPPPPNSLAVKIIGLLFPAFAVVGIVAAIAIPQYQHHVQRGSARVQGH